MIRLLFIVYTACVLLPYNLKAQNAAAPKTYAIVIGISAYQSKALPVLKYADKDAGLFALYLQSKAGGSVPAAQIKLLLNEKATIAAVYDAMDWLKERCRKNDVAYIYFSGHGDVETKNAFRLGYLLAYNTPPNNYANNAIRIEALNKDANTLSIKNKAKVILITDACHSGKLAGDFFKGKQLVASQLQLVLNNEVRLASCATNQEAAEGPDWDGGRGVFSYYLLLGLKGLADLENDGSVKLRNISKFLDSSFASDKYLLLDNHKQNPVTDGNPNFKLAVVDAATLAIIKAARLNNNSTTTNLSAGLQAFKPLGTQPVDAFFASVRNQPLEGILDFDGYKGTAAEALPLKIVNDCIAYQEALYKERDSIGNNMDEDTYNSYEFANLDTMKILKGQLVKSKSAIAGFNEKFVQLVHDKGQEMINAYLEGDLAELEKRQYYYAGNRQYNYFLSMLRMARQIVPESHRLAQVLAINASYLTGLIDRMNMATYTNTDSLLQLAFAYQRKALLLEPYAAYIHNELGNLFLHQQKFDSASYHFSLASVLSPSWAIPWSNKIRLNLAANNLSKAKEAIRKSDSLQSNLSFAMMNAGLVMERDSNWLAAETLYKKAIVLNKVHFLPFERLGSIYMRTGAYDEADNFLYEANSRKKDFAINDSYFKYGVELGGIQFEAAQKQKDSCIANFDSGNTRLHPYIRLAKALQNIETAPADTVKNLQLLKDVLQEAPNTPLAHHYLGKLLFKQGKWQAANDALLQSLANYQAEPAARTRLIKLLYNDADSTTDLCLFNVLMYYHYDVLEDHYLLAEVYEKQQAWNKAMEEYKLISTIENQHQTAQAGYEHYPADIPVSQVRSNIELYNQLMTEYEGLVRMGGAIKLARLYEQQGQYIQAEKVLLKQVELNRTAGFIRQAALDSSRPGSWQLPNLKINFYWLAINRDLEGETYNFYKRMTALFPRDFEWKEKAGLFLQKRLAMAYRKMPVDQYVSFSESINNFKYPFTSDEMPAAEEETTFAMPGTSDSITIKMPVYDPVKESLDLLQQSVKLSPDVEPRREVAEAIADLDSWLGNSEEAIKIYKQIVEKNPANDALRNKLIGYLLANDDLSGAYIQLDSLWNRKQLTMQQIPLLAGYHILSGKYNEAMQILKNCQPQNDNKKYDELSLYAEMNWLSGKPQKALTFLLDSLPVVTLDKKDNDEVKLYKQQQINFRLYSIARIYSLTNNPDKALSALQQSLDSGFNCKYVLDNDPVWSTVRNTEKWKALTEKYSFEKDYPLGLTKSDKNPISYRIPGLSLKK